MCTYPPPNKLQSLGLSYCLWLFNYYPDPVSLVRDHTIKQKLGELGISVQSYNGDLLYEPWEIYDNEGHAFTTFDAYWTRCLSMQKEPDSHLPPWRLVPVEGTLTVQSCQICMLSSN